MNHLACCCRWPDRFHCYAARYGKTVYELERDEFCGCCCHEDDGNEPEDEETP